jgi:hypothetical protein
MGMLSACREEGADGRRQKASVATARPLEIVWSDRLGTAGWDEVWDVAVDAQGGCYVAGRTNGKLGDAHAGGEDIFVAKYAPDGRRLWVRQVGSETDDYGCKIGVDQQGNCYVLGQASGGTGRGDGEGGDGFLVKFDRHGNRQWLHSIGTPEHDEVKRLAVDNSGNCYVMGVTTGSLGGDNQGKHDVFVVKVDPDGKRLWARQTGTSAADGGFEMQVDSTGNCVILARIYPMPGDAKPNQWRVFLVKYDAEGIQQWRTFLQPDDPVGAYIMALDASGNCYLAGDAHGDAENVQGAAGIGIVKYDAAGKRLWARQVTTGRPEWVDEIAIDRDGHCVVVGTTKGDLAAAGQGGHDVFVLKFTADGKRLWSRQFGGPDSDKSNDLAIDAQGTCYIAGWSTRPPAKGELGLWSTGFLTVIDRDGTVIDEKTFAPDRMHRASCVAAFPSGGCLIGGKVDDDGVKGTERRGRDVAIIKVGRPAR